MRKQLSFIFALLVILEAPMSRAEDYISKVKEGNKAYSTGQYDQALDLYHSAETDLPASPELQYNLAGALYQKEKYEESVDMYTKALNTTDPALQEQAHYNLGNTYFKMGDYEKSIKSFQDALNLNPNDVDAKFNLELARKMLKEQIKPQQQNQDQQQQQKEKQDQQQQQQQDQQQNQQDKKDQQNQQQASDQSDDNQKDKNQQQQQQSVDDKKMSKEDAERILNALKDDEQNIQKRINRQNRTGNYTGKDW